MYETHVTVMGRLVADPETRTTTQGEVFTTFRLATSERRRTREGIFEDGPTSSTTSRATGRWASTPERR